MNDDHDEELEARFRRIAIDMDEDIGSPPQSADDDDGPRLTISLEATAIEGVDVSVSYTFSEEDMRAFFLSRVDSDEEHQHMINLLFILSLAGAKTFADPINRNLFIQPEPNWIQLYFEQLPQAASDPVFGPLLWSVYSSIEVWLTDGSGNELRRLKLVPPTTAETES